METKTSFNQYIPTNIVFGRGELNNLHKQQMPGKKALLVISNGTSTKVNGYLARTEEQLTKAGVDYVLFDRIEHNPLRATVMSGAEIARENNCDPFDSFGDETRPDKEEEMLNRGKLILPHLHSRRLLRRVMTEAGFRMLPSEWWHFNLISREEAKNTLQAIQ